jgi:excisionase family DNA binding protein
MEPKEYLTVKEICNYLNVKETHLRSMVYYKKIPFKKIGNTLRFDLDEIKKWLKQNSYNPCESK